MKDHCEPWLGEAGFFRAPLFIGPALGTCCRVEDYACFLYDLQFSADMDLECALANGMYLRRDIRQ
jgi:hypothetical protein